MLNFIIQKHKDRFHNQIPARIERSKKFAPKITRTITVKVSNISELLDAKINHPFADMSEYGDRG